MILDFICRAILLSVPLLYGAIGEIITEKSGHLNLGIPGIMYTGAISSVVGAFLYENACGNNIDNMNPVLAVIIPLLCAIFGSAFMGLIYSFLTVALHANQNVTGLAISTFGVGLGNFLGASLIGITGSELPSITLSKTSSFFTAKIPFADDLGWLGKLLFSYDFLTYTSIILAVVTSLVLNRTRIGLNLRSVGENPATADATGVNVSRYRYLATCIGSAIAGLGGLQYLMAYATGTWSNNAFGDRGWMAIALVIFALWKPSVAIFGAFLFAALGNANTYLKGLGPETQELFKMLPYVVAIIVLIIVSVRRKKENQPPQGLGLNYFREER